MATFYGWGSTSSRLVPIRGGSLLFATKFPDIPGTHFTHRKDERLSRPWNHPVVLNLLTNMNYEKIFLIRYSKKKMENK